MDAFNIDSSYALGPLEISMMWISEQDLARKQEEARKDKARRCKKGARIPEVIRRSTGKKRRVAKKGERSDRKSCPRKSTGRTNKNISTAKSCARKGFSRTKSRTRKCRKNSSFTNRYGYYEVSK